MDVNVSLKDLFHQACRDGDLERISCCLSLGYDVNFYDKDYQPALFYGVQNMNILNILLGHPNIDVNVKEHGTEMTALMKACKIGRPEVVKRLCEVPGIDFHCVSSGRVWMGPNGFTAAQFAVDGIMWQGSRNCVQVLSTFDGVDWNCDELNGRTPVMMAAMHANVDILKILLSIRSVKLDLTFGEKSIVHIVVSSTYAKSLKCLELLSKNERVKCWNTRFREETSLELALRTNQTEKLKILMTVPSLDVSVLQDVKINSCLMDYLKAVRPKEERITTPECPICFENYRKDDQIFQCSSGHFVCGRCRPQVRTCPVCRDIIVGRCHGFENFLRTLKI